MEYYEAYIALLSEISHALSQLTETAHRKAEAVRQDDLAQLNEVIKQEQALSLSLRGCEQKRVALLAHMGLEEVPLTTLADHYPPALRPTAKAAAESLRQHFQVYSSASTMARNLLERNLHQIEQYLDAAQTNAPGPGYAPADNVQLPPSLRSDFRA